MYIKYSDKMGRNLPVDCLTLAGTVGHRAAACAPHTADAGDPGGSAAVEPSAGAGKEKDSVMG